MAFLSKVALSAQAEPDDLIQGLQNNYPELRAKQTEQGFQLWLEGISLVPNTLFPDHDGIVVSTPFLPAREDLQLHADIILLMQENDEEAIFSSSEGVVIQYPDEHYTEERMEQWFLSETEKFFNLLKKDEDFLIPFLHRPFHAGEHARSYWWRAFRKSHESATDELMVTLRKLQYPGIDEAPAFHVNSGAAKVQMAVFDNRNALLLPPCPRLGFFNPNKKELFTIPGAELRNILPKEWTLLDEYYCLAPVLPADSFELLMTRASEIENKYR